MDSREQAMDALRLALVTAARSAAASIYDEWVVLTGEHSMPLDSSRAIRFETLAVCIHAMNRFALVAGGPEARAAIQDAVAQGAIKEALAGPSGRGGAHQGFETAEWQEWMTEDILLLVNAADRDYTKCGELASNSGLAPFRSDTVFGKLASRIARQVGREELMPLRLAIWNCALAALRISRLKEHVEEACKVLK
ncbi:MAG: hypothetical protein EXR53_00290 [Dehalococcoidia bacterium]|nr:hypothetical protein [Dehalococcoidia bacterium]